jgi:hypothetical protein
MPPHQVCAKISIFFQKAGGGKSGPTMLRPDRMLHRKEEKWTYCRSHTDGKAHCSCSGFSCTYGASKGRHMEACPGGTFADSFLAQARIADDTREKLSTCKIQDRRKFMAMGCLSLFYAFRTNIHQLYTCFTE